ncbi:hypothetical protein HNQ56_001484 [Anaerotaenia torta]|uniref:family 43 glycosylhydrolase n=1 Tax=Anaerotaenia torta TaxID=433293 RepID=UPI003D25C34C
MRRNDILPMLFLGALFLFAGCKKEAADMVPGADIAEDSAVALNGEKEDTAEFAEKTDLIELCLEPKLTSGNPAITHIFTADPSAHVWDDGRIYLYASHDMDPSRGCDLMDRYHVFSSEDMANWVDEGEILRSEDVSWGREEGGFMWAPDCAYQDGSYYFYYPHPREDNWNESWKVGVAVSWYPDQDFTDQGYIEGVGGFAMIDPAVFQDDDGRNYFYYGGGGRCQGAELGDDMMSLKTGLADMEGLRDFHEGTWVFKRNHIYYLIYADGQSGANRMRYAASSSPLGPWTSQGVLLESAGCNTTHGSVVEFHGEWYLFYHNQAISGNGTLRSVCIDRLEFDENGAIRPVQQTRDGIPALSGEVAQGIKEAYQEFYSYDATKCQVSNGAVINKKTDGSGEAAICNLYQENAECRFTGVDGGDGGRATIFIHYAAGGQWSKLRIVVNGVDQSLINAKSTGGWTDYSGVTSITVKLKEGTDNTIRIIGGYGGINIDGIVVGILE